MPDLDAPEEEGDAPSWSPGQVAILSLAAGHLRRAGQLLESVGEEMRRSREGARAWQAAESVVKEKSHALAEAEANPGLAEELPVSGAGASSSPVDGSADLKLCIVPSGVDARDLAVALRLLEAASVCMEAEKALQLVAARKQTMCEAAGVALWMFVVGRICLLVAGVSPTSPLAGSMAKAVLDEGLLCLSAQQHQGSYGIMSAGVRGVFGGCVQWVDASMGAWIGAGLAACPAQHPAVKLRETLRFEAQAIIRAQLDGKRSKSSR